MTGFDTLDLEGGGRLLLSAFPAGDDHRERLAAAGAGALVSLTTAMEMSSLGLPPAALAAWCERRAVSWHHLPTPDMGTAEALLRDAWPALGPRLHGLLDEGRAVAVHCRMGLGRTGTLAALLLVERGLPPTAAIAAVRRARPGSIETAAQERLVAAWRA